jgi:predicted ester cyclase
MSGAPRPRPAAGPRPGTPPGTPPGGARYNKALARRWFEQGWNLGNLAAAEEIFAPGFVLRGKTVGPKGPQASVRGIRSAFADLVVQVQLQVAEQDLVATRYTATGRHSAEYRGIPPTGRTVRVFGVQIWRVRDGMAVEDWNSFDEWGLVSQIGELRAVPFG